MILVLTAGLQGYPLAIDDPIEEISRRARKENTGSSRQHRGISGYSLSVSPDRTLYAGLSSLPGAVDAQWRERPTELKKFKNKSVTPALLMCSAIGYS